MCVTSDFFRAKGIKKNWKSDIFAECVYFCVCSSFSFMNGPSHFRVPLIFLETLRELFKVATHSYCDAFYKFYCGREFINFRLKLIKGGDS